MMYVSQNAPRICRALFEICLRRSWSTAADMALTMCKVRLRRWHVRSTSMNTGSRVMMSVMSQQRASHVRALSRV